MRLYVSEAQCVCMCVYVSETCFFITSTGVIDTRKYSQLFLSVWRFEHRSLCLQNEGLYLPGSILVLGRKKIFSLLLGAHLAGQQTSGSLLPLLSQFWD